MDNIYSKNQIFLFDNLKGIAIFLIFLHHSPADILAEPFLMVMMPVFAFVSGYSMKGVLKISAFENLFVLYLLIHILALPFGIFASVKYGWNIPNLFFAKAGISWYILALFIWAGLLPVFMAGKYPVALSFAASIFANLALSEIPHSRSDIFYAMTFHIAAYFPYFVAGASVSWESVIKFRLSKLRYIFIPFAVAGFFLCGSGIIDTRPFSANISKFKIVLYALGALGSLLFLAGFCPGYKIKFLTKFGQRSMNIYVAHVAIIVLSMRCISLLTHSDILIFCSAVAVAFACCVALSSDLVTGVLNNAILRIRRLVFKGN